MKFATKPVRHYPPHRRRRLYDENQFIVVNENFHFRRRRRKNTVTTSNIFYYKKITVYLVNNFTIQLQLNYKELEVNLQLRRLLHFRRTSVIHCPANSAGRQKLLR